jgi:uncharacterized protein YcsI (UPF0317 family)
MAAGNADFGIADFKKSDFEINVDALTNDMAAFIACPFEPQLDKCSLIVL